MSDAKSGPRGRFTDFALVGLSGLLVNQAVLWALTEGARLHYVVSAVLATQCSTLWNFALVERLVFRAGSPGRLGRLLRFAAVNNAWLIVRGPVLVGLTEWAHAHYLLSNFIVLGAATVARFLLAERWIWGAGRPDARIHRYDIHGIVRIESEARLPELAAFEVQEPAGPADLHVAIDGRGFGGLRRRVKTETLVDLDAKTRTVTYVEHLGRLGFAAEFEMGSTVRVRASRLLAMSPHVLYTNVVEPTLRWLFVERGYALVHSACIEVDGRGLLITAETDTGKTTTCLRAIRAFGVGFASDDMSIFTPDGTVLSYPKPLTISAHTLKAAKAAPLPLGRKLLLQVQGRIHSKSGRSVGLWLAEHNLPAATLNAVVQMIVPPPKYHVEQLIPGARIVSSVRPEHLVVIERGDLLTQPLDIGDACEVLAANTEDAYQFPPYQLIGVELANGHQGAEARLHRMLVQTVPVTRLRSPDRDWFHRLPALLNDGAGAAAARAGSHGSNGSRIGSTLPVGSHGSNGSRIGSTLPVGSHGSNGSRIGSTLPVGSHRKDSQSIPRALEIIE